uniref:Uncharacterized protein n=1 Tax=Ursus americanus TaxID=9643 RepID=A0A452RM30_URSAM
MIRKTTQRPTGKTAVPRHPFFIGSRPEPVFCGGIFSSLFGAPPNCDLGVLISENILSKWVGKSKFGISRSYRAAGNPRVLGEGWDSLPCGGRILQQAAAGPRSAPAPLLRGFRVPEAEEAGGAERDREAEAWGGCVLGGRRFPAGRWGRARCPPPALGARGGGTATLCTGRGEVGLFRRLPPPFNSKVKSCLAFS